MNRYEKYGLNDQDLEFFTDYVKYYCGDEVQGVVKMSISGEQYLEEWEKAKSDFLFSAFQNKLIHREEVCFKTPLDKIKQDLEESFSDDMRNLIDSLGLLFEAAFLDSASWKSMIYADSQDDAVTFFSTIHYNLTKIEPFAENCCGFNASLKRDGHSISISSAQKPFRAINAIVKVCTPIARAKFPKIFSNSWFRRLQRDIEYCRIIHSRILSTTTMKGTLCLSIHPLDYITASDNTYHWDSCITWTRENHSGEYRLGTIEMMNSPIVVVAYLEGSKPYHPIFMDKRTWSNKKWREFFIVDKNIISNIKSYPFEAIELEDIILQKLANLMERAHCSSYNHKVKSGNCTYINDCQVQFRTKNMYNDASLYSHRYLTAKRDSINYVAKAQQAYYEINYSGESLCVTCGSPFIRLDTEKFKLNCEKCEGGIRCGKCHELKPDYYEDYGFDIGGKWYCEECATVCSICGVPEVEENTINIGINFSFTKTEPTIAEGHLSTSAVVDKECFKKIQPYLTKAELYKTKWLISPSAPREYLDTIVNDVLKSWGYNPEHIISYQVL